MTTSHDPRLSTRKPAALSLWSHALAPVAELPVLEVVSAMSAGLPAADSLNQHLSPIWKSPPSSLQPANVRSSRHRRGRLVDRVAVITGAASGIGKEIALAYARDGAEVVIADLDRKAAQETAAAIDPTLQRALGIAMDVSNEDEVEAGIKGNRNLRAPRVGTVTIRGTGETIEALLDPTAKPARDETLQASRAPPIESHALAVW